MVVDGRVPREVFTTSCRVVIPFEAESLLVGSESNRDGIHLNIKICHRYEVANRDDEREAANLG